MKLRNIGAFEESACGTLAWEEGQLPKPSLNEASRGDKGISLGATRGLPSDSAEIEKARRRCRRGLSKFLR